MRLFVGIPLPAAVIDQLAAVAHRLQANGDGLRWSAPESWHVTLQFLGNTSQEQYECAVARLHQLHLPSVPVQLERIDSFDRTGVLFVGVKIAPELLLLQESVTAATKHCGFTPESRPYQPHITLARSKRNSKGLGLQALKTKINHQPHFTRVVAEEFLLYESFLGPAGSHYEIREHFALGHRSCNDAGLPRSRF